MRDCLFGYPKEHCWHSDGEYVGDPNCVLPGKAKKLVYVIVRKCCRCLEATKTAMPAPARGRQA